MMIVQKVEFSAFIITGKSLRFLSSVSPRTCIVSVLLRFYVVVIYIHHFRSTIFVPARKALWLHTTIGIMTNPEMSDIRYFSPYPL